MSKFNGPPFIVRIIIGTIFCTVLMTVGILLLWNWLIPEIFNGPSISFLQALGLLVLGKLFFGFGFRQGGCGGKGKFGHGPKGYWRERWEQKLAHMSPEEREKAKEKYKKCCPWDFDDTKEASK